MKALFVSVALSLAGASHAAPTTFYFSGTSELHRYIDGSTNTWVDGAAGQSFSGSITVDGGNGTLTSVLGYPASVESMRRSTSSRCDLVFMHGCSADAADPTNFLGFTLNFNGSSYGSWATGRSAYVEYSTVTKLRTATMSSYTVMGGTSMSQVVGTLPDALTRVDDSVGLGLTLEGSYATVGDVYDPGQFPDLSSVVPGLSELRFNSSGFSCRQVDGACQDVAFDPGSIVLIGKLNYVGLTPEILAELPEPGTAALMLVGVLGLFGSLKRGQRKGLTA